MDSAADIVKPDTKKPKVKKSLANLKKRNEIFWGFLMIAPAVIGLSLFYVVPIFETVYYSFTNYKGLNEITWAGFENYQNLFADQAMWTAIGNTLLFAGISVPICIALSILLAVLLNSKIKGIGVYRTLFFIPTVTLPTAVAMVWKWLYNGEYGLINTILGSLNIAGLNWLTDSNLVLISIMLVWIWGGIGYYMIILLAGLQDIPDVYYEAAKIDGAGPVKRFFKVTLPLLSPTIFFVVVNSMIAALQIFDLIWVMISTKSPVIEDAQSVVFLFYKYGFVQYNKGYASAIAVVLFVFILLITLVQLRLQKKWVHYE